MDPAVHLKAGDIDFPSLKLRWPDLTFAKRQITVFTGSPNAPISDFFFFLAGLQQARRITSPAKDGRLIREEASVPKETLAKLMLYGKPLYGIPEAERAKAIGFIFNDPELSVVGATAREDIDHAFAAVEMCSPSLKICKHYGFNNDTLLRRVDVLSGGELHRLLCLIAVERRPSVLFVDLTRSNVDEDFLSQLRGQLCSLAEKDCCVFIAGIDPECLPVGTVVLQVNDDGCVTQQHTSREPPILTQAAELAKLVTPRRITAETVLTAVDVCRQGVTQPISLSIKRGELVALYGPNGCGKTTLGLVITGRCKDSQVTGHARPAKQVKPVLALQYAGRAFVEDSLYAEHPDSTFWKLLGFEDHQTKCHPRAVGYGLQKLAACALALMRSRGLCILDEPTCGMDFSLRIRFVELLNRHVDTSVLMFTHDAALKSVGRLVNYSDIST